MDYTDPQYWPQLIQLAATIDTLDYYQVLNLAQGCNRTEVQKSYYSMARALHPDKFYHLEDENLRASIHKIYKRITESYSVLRDDQKRKRYTEDINGPERAAKLRYTEESEAQQKQEEREAKEVCKTAQGKKMLAAAQVDIQNGRFDSAFRNLQSAIMFEPGNATLTALKEQVAAKRKK